MPRHVVNIPKLGSVRPLVRHQTNASVEWLRITILSVNMCLFLKIILFFFNSHNLTLFQLESHVCL